MTDSEAIAILECQKSKIGDLKRSDLHHLDFKKWQWDTEVAIEKIFGGQSRRTQQFSQIPYSPSVISPSQSPNVLHLFYLKGLEEADAVLDSMIEEIKQDGMPEEAVPEVAPYEYISHERLAELRALHPADYDLRKLIRLCEEINTNFRNECWFAVATLTRALIDHVPPIFGQNTFVEMANNYSGGGKSFKSSMQHLQRSSRSIADSYLHTPIRKNESLPMATQVNFAPDLDVLLEEIVRVLR